MVKWLIQKIYEDRMLEEALDKLGIEHQDVSLKELYTNDFNPDEQFCLYTSIESLKWLTNRYKWKNFAPFSELTCQKYYAYWGKYLLNNDYLILPLAELIRKFEEICHSLESGNELFTRPDTNDKIFTGEVRTKEDLERLIKGAGVAPETLTIATYPINIDREWRLVMNNGKLVTGSLYKQNGEVKEREDTSPKELAESLEPYPGLPPVYILDIAEINGDYFLLEAGSVNCAGFYSCDREKIVNCMTRELELMYKEE